MNPHDDERAARMGRIWDDLVNGIVPSDADPELLSSILDVRDWAAAPSPSSNLRSSIWQRITPVDDVILPARPRLTASPNGHAVLPETAQIAIPAPRTRAIDWAALYRTLAIGAMAGLAAGFGAGIWARIAMRLSGFLTIYSNRGLLTESEAVVGTITLGGTIFLGLFGAAIGIFGGVLYMAIRRWLPRRSTIRALVFGVLLLAVFGFILMDEDNPDYQRFGPTWLNVGTFSLAYLVFGALASLIADALDTRLPRVARDPLRGRNRIWQWIVMSPFAMFGIFAVAFSLFSAVADPVAGIVAGLLVISGLGYLLPRVNTPVLFGDARFQRAIGFAALIPGLFGVWLTIAGIVGIFTG